jgi:hypothetical protein
MEHLKEILSLKDGDCYIVPESDYGKAEIWLKNDMYFLFAIPMYGGPPMFSGAFNKRQVENMIIVIESWT